MRTPELRQALAAFACVALLAGCGTTAAAHPAATTRTVVTPPTATTTTQTGIVTVPPAGPPSPAAARLDARLRRALGRSGGRVGALVVDINTGAALFAANADVARAPASLQKLYTSVALLQMLGPAARLQTQVLGVGRLARGVWHGNLYLRGGGDPTFGDGSWNTFYEGGHGPTAAQLARALYKAGIRRVTGLLYADPSRFNAQLGGPATHYHADIPDYGGELSALVFDHGATGFGLGPAAFADHQVAVAMQNAGIGLQAARRTARTPLDARVLASVNSPPLRVLLRLMNVPSDDLFADLLTKQLGYQTLHEGTLAAGAEIIRQVLSIRYQLRPRMFDGSGLDKADRSSPDQIVSLLRQIWGTPVGAVLLRSLPTVGINGTVQTIADGTAAQGRCVAKTGTLNNVTNVAGYCAARSGQTLAFALMIDGPPNWVAVTPLGRMLAAIAGY